MNPCTPGPWHVDEESATATVRDNRGRPVARCYKGDDDAYLIAAAPDLLDAARCALADLEGIMPEFEPSGDREHPAWQTIKELRAAIAKATQP